MSVRSEETTVSLKMADFRQRRQEAKQARKKIGAHYLKYRQEKDDGDLHSANDKENGEDNSSKWLKEIQEDPYINESTRILQDMALNPVASATQ